MPKLPEAEKTAADIAWRRGGQTRPAPRPACVLDSSTESVSPFPIPVQFGADVDIRIPAVVIYNMFARSIANYRALYADASVEILTLVSRDLSQPPAARHDTFDPRRRPAAVPMAE